MKTRFLACLVMGLLGAGVILGQEEASSRAPKRLLHIPMSVAWEMTRSEFSKESLATQSEHFRETWYVEARGAEIYVVSPRARVMADAMGYASPESELPRHVVLTEADFLQLFGVPALPVSETEVNPEPLITLQLIDAPSKGEDFSFSLAKEEFITIHVDLDL